MRTPRNDALTADSKNAHPEPLPEVREGSGAILPGSERDTSPLPDFREGLEAGTSRHVPERTCILSRTHGRRDMLIRLALSPDGDVLPDVRAKAPGRGAWIGVDRAALDVAVAKGKLQGALKRAFKTVSIAVPSDLGARIEDALARAALERLGLEARASMLITGAERVEDAARKGQVALLLHAADAAEGGRRRLDQAWRVGMDAEGSGRSGLVLAADRTMLSTALGRENAVHIGIVDDRAALRVAAMVDRWHGFVGKPVTHLACTSASESSGPRGRAADLSEELRVT